MVIPKDRFLNDPYILPTSAYQNAQLVGEKLINPKNTLIDSKFETGALYIRRTNIRLTTATFNPGKPVNYKGNLSFDWAFHRYTCSYDTM